MASGGVFKIVVRMSCAVRMGRDKLNAGVRSEFLGIRTGLTLIASRSGILVSTSVAVKNSSARSCLDLAAAHLAFFREDVEGDPLVFPRRAMLSIFIFNDLKNEIKSLNKGQLFIKSIYFVCR